MGHGLASAERPWEQASSWNGGPGGSPGILAALTGSRLHRGRWLGSGWPRPGGRGQVLSVPGGQFGLARNSSLNLNVEPPRRLGWPA